MVMLSVMLEISCFVTVRSCLKTVSLSLLLQSIKGRKIVSKARVNTRGFVYVKKSRDILSESADIVNATVENYLAGDNFDWGELKGAVRDDVAKFLFDQTKRRPAILPVVMEVR